MIESLLAFLARFVLAIALTGLLSVPVLAGNIPTNGVVETPRQRQLHSLQRPARY
jgi:hypothetical protein